MGSEVGGSRGRPNRDLHVYIHTEAGTGCAHTRMLTPLIEGLGHSFSIPSAVVLAKSLVYFRALVALQLLVSLISCVVACSARIETHTHRPSTVTLATHARRGLMTHFWGGFSNTLRESLLRVALCCICFTSSTAKPTYTTRETIGRQTG